MKTVDGWTFEAWMAHIDYLLLPRMGVTTADIADRCYYDAWADGVMPQEIVQDILIEGIDAL